MLSLEGCSALQKCLDAVVYLVVLFTQILINRNTISFKTTFDCISRNFLHNTYLSTISNRKNQTVKNG